MSLSTEIFEQIFSSVVPSLVLQLAAWQEAAPRFRSFVETYRDKIRKKVRGAQVDGGLDDVLAELAVAALLLRDRRLAVEFEKLGVGKGRAPDLTVTFKTHTPFHVEVTRLRPPEADGTDEVDALVRKIANTFLAKLGQLQPSIINLLAFVVDEQSASTHEIQAAVEGLRSHAVQKDDPFFARHGLVNSRHFQRQQARLSGVLLCTFTPPAGPRLTALWLNPQARHPVPTELKNLLRTLV
ncbi:MAG: hypothetical protein DCC55_27220 [Chloroflexi bacterium]|nr:MAG: hypothetical protein DCC55_27220 [Chloroflexota bacterium]